MLSTLSTEARDADARAFAALIKHIRQIDQKEQTVVMVQVENEIGTMGTRRDFSDLVNAAFRGPVPADLMRYLEKNNLLSIRVYWKPGKNKDLRKVEHGRTFLAKGYDTITGRTYPI